MSKSRLSQNIKRLREEKAWSQEKLAEKAKVSYHTIFRAEAGAIPITKNLQKIANALGVTETELLSNPKEAQDANFERALDAINELNMSGLSNEKKELMALIPSLSDTAARLLLNAIRKRLGLPSSD